MHPCVLSDWPASWDCLELAVTELARYDLLFKTLTRPQNRIPLIPGMTSVREVLEEQAGPL